ncbi:MAG: peptidyl-prolyl cis-trans isomerase [Saprospiraceae bacterium]|nr:peptidyl-prolyl cis-trans isomerase [Saprospiraceae bacterium]
MVLIVGLCSIITQGCDLNRKSSDDQLLASAFGESLYLSDINSSLVGNLNPNDSMHFIDQQIDNWLMDVILMNEAKKKNIKDTGIKDLVKDYERSLYVHGYEKDYLKNNLDTVVLDTMIKTFYETNKEDFILNSRLVRVFMIRLVDSLVTEELTDLWKSEDLPALKALLNNVGGFYLLDHNGWYTENEIKLYIPESMYKQISLRKPNSYIRTIDGSKYFVKVIEIFEEGDYGPVNYYKKNIRERILHQRSRTLIQKMKNDLFKSNVKNKGIKIYSKAS